MKVRALLRRQETDNMLTASESEDPRLRQLTTESYELQNKHLRQQLIIDRRRAEGEGVRFSKDDIAFIDGKAG